MGKKLLQTVRKFNKVKRLKINIQRLPAFTYINKNENVRKDPTKITTRNLKEF